MVEFNASREVIKITINQCCGSRSGIRCLFDPWIRDPGWVNIRIRDEQPGSYFRELAIKIIFWVKILKFFNGDPGSGMEKYESGIRDRKISDPG
jgi:hypothetical protein